MGRESVMEKNYNLAKRRIKINLCNMINRLRCIGGEKVKTERVLYRKVINICWNRICWPNWRMVKDGFQLRWWCDRGGSVDAEDEDEAQMKIILLNWRKMYWEETENQNEMNKWKWGNNLSLHYVHSYITYVLYESRECLVWCWRRNKRLPSCCSFAYNIPYHTLPYLPSTFSINNSNNNNRSKNGVA